MPPSKPIDSEMPSNDTIYVLEETLLWRGTSVGGGNTVWEELFDAADYEADLGAFQLSRVKVYGSTIYMVGGTTAEGATTGDAYFFRSRNAGLTWNYSLIAAASFDIKPYTVDVRTFGTSGPATINLLYTMYATHERFDGDEVENPWAMAATFDIYTGTCGGYEWETLYAFDGDVPAQATSMNPNVNGTKRNLPGPLVVGNTSLDGAERALMIGYLDDYFGEDGWVWASGDETPTYSELPNDETRIHAGFQSWVSSLMPAGPCREASYQYTGKSYAIFRYPHPFLPTALDAAPTNIDWVYVGSDEKVYKSEDGGYTWVELITDRGAYDILVDPEQAGTAYMWATNGELNVIVNGAINATLDTETALRKFYRLARCPTDSRLMALKSGTDLRLRTDSVWSDLKDSLVDGCGLHWYAGQKLIFVDNTDIWVSDDDGTTIAAKKGGWSGYDSPVNAHRLSD